MATKWSGQGSSLEVEIATVFTAIPSLRNVKFPTPVSQYENTTTIDDSASTYTPTLNDVGELEYEMLWDPTNSTHHFLMTEGIKAAGDKLLINFKAKSNTASGLATVAFSAYISFEAEAPTNAAMTATLRLRQSGTMTYTQ